MLEFHYHEIQLAGLKEKALKNEKIFNLQKLLTRSHIMRMVPLEEISKKLMIIFIKKNYIKKCGQALE